MLGDLCLFGSLLLSFCVPVQVLAKNPLRVMDGKDDRADLLTEINPQSINRSRIYRGSIIFPTFHREVGRTTKIEHVKALAVLNHDRLYERYLQKKSGWKPI